MINEFNHYGIVIRNLDASLAFYQGVLGAKIVFRGLIPVSRTDVVYLQIGGGLIELLHRPDPPANEMFGITHLAFMSDDLDADYARLVMAGHEGLVAPKVAGTGNGRLAFVRGPDGARVELIQRDGKMREAPIAHPVVKSFDHYSLTANDLDGAMGFYQGLLGMRTLKEMSVPASELSITYLNYDYDVLELLHRPTPNTADTTYGHFALRVDDADAALAAFAAKGVAAEPGTPKPAGTGIGRIGMIRDPDGVKIELVDRPDLRSL
jgi:catechol 2,3-dioxygenase-like lactoylglutathione lyase family enzyme